MRVGEERASEIHKWRRELPKNHSFTEVAEVGEVMLMLNPGAVTPLKLASAFGV